MPFIPVLLAYLGAHSVNHWNIFCMASRFHVVNRNALLQAHL